MASTLPEPPSIEDLRDAGILPDEMIEWTPGDVVWRVHRTTGPHVLAWNGLRTFGPVLRFDHHPLPPADRTIYGIWYGASNPRGALAEAFQSSRTVDRRHCEPFLTSVKFVRGLRLLDVSGIGTGVWATRVGGNHALDSAAHRRTQHWAKTIHRTHDNLDGIIYRGRYAGTVCMALFERASDAFPALPEFSAPLSHPALADRVYTAAHELGYTII